MLIVEWNNILLDKFTLLLFESLLSRFLKSDELIKELAKGL
jgi:hypothetical protein